MSTSPSSSGEPHILAEFDEGGVVGVVTIAPRVLVEIIAMTAEGVPGVVKVARSRRVPHKRIHAIRSTDAGDDSGDWHSERGVKVRIKNEAVDASVSLSVRGGTSVPELAEQVQERVGVAIEKMLGMKTGPISVHIVEFTPETDRT